MASVPIRAYRVRGGGAPQPEIRREPEKSAQSFKLGTPVKISGGYVIEQPTIDGAHVIAGFSTEPASSLTSDGVAKELSYGSVPNQTNAKIIPLGAPPNLGDVGFVVANFNTLFAGALKSDQAVAIALVGALSGLVKDSNGFWYLDTTVTNPANGAVCEIVGLIDAVGTLGGQVEFRITQAACQLLA